MDIKDMKRGEWMPGDVKPEAPGVWERDYTDTEGTSEVPFYSLFDGELWRIWAIKPAKAAAQKGVSIHQSLPWRGQLEYDPHNAPPGFVADLAPEGEKGCIGCEILAQFGACGNWLSQARYPCCRSARPDGRSVILKRAKP